MKNLRYFDTFAATIASTSERFVPAKVLMGIWNAPVIAIVLLWNLLMVWQHREEMRLQLRSIDNRALNDMGMARSDARRESDKPFWQG